MTYIFYQSKRGHEKAHRHYKLILRWPFHNLQEQGHLSYQTQAEAQQDDQLFGLRGFYVRELTVPKFLAVAARAY